MSNPPKRGWGSLLSGAVAGLESKLDVILTDDDQASAKERAAEKEKKDKEKLLKVEQNTSRASSKTRPNDRLQARLAQAVGKNASSDGGSKAGSGRSSVDLPPSRPQTPVAKVLKDTVELQEDTHPSDMKETPSQDEAKKALEPETEPLPQNDAKAGSEHPTVEESIKPVEKVQPVADSLKNEQISTPDSTIAQIPDTQSSETHEYLEQIDALHSKIAYLSTQLHANATTAADAAQFGSLERKSAEQDAKIAQLMQEGQKLSLDQLKYSQAIKTLRSRLQEQDKINTETRKKLDKSESEARELQDRLKSSESREKAANSRIETLSVFEKDLNNARLEKEDALKQVTQLKRQAEEAERRADEAAKRVQTSKLEEQSKLVSELQDELSNTKIEKKLLEDRVKAEMKEVKEAHNRQLEKSKVAEMELKVEIQNMESKLEVLRLRSEEDSASTTSDAQAKLLRQIETLQTQYSLASENWQGIETSLNTRITTLEKERDDLAKREADVRKKARETNSKARRLEEELEISIDKAATFEFELATLKNSWSKIETKITTAEQEAQAAKQDLDRTKKDIDSTVQSRLEEERSKMRAEMMQSFSPVTPSESNHFLRTDSFPLHTSRKASGDIGGSQRRSNTGNRTQTPDLASLFPMHSPDSTRPNSKRSGIRPGPLRMPTDPSILGRAESTSPSFQNINGGIGTPPTTFQSGTPSIHTIDVDEVDDFPTRESPPPTVNELISVSTAGAGPSVQLVERMSATVRKLEMEKTASREEIARLQSQRDEARDEVVSLMRESESMKADHEKVEQLEREVEQLHKRHEAALELIGEKTEECDELRNDVIDLKKIYRELVETMK